MANTIKLKRASGSDPGNSDLAAGELAIRTSNCKLFSKNDSGSAVGIVAGSADTLTTARTIAGVSFDGSANISLNNNAITNGAAYIADLVSDTSPQLGGDLDVQSSKITTATSNGNVQVEPNGTGVFEVRGAGGNDGTLQLNCSAQSHGIKLKSPAHSAGATYTLTFPDNIVNGQFLKTDSSGNLSWAAALSDVVSDTSPQLGGDLASNGNDILLADSDKAKFGAGGDLEIYHDGTNSNINETGTGSLLFYSSELYFHTGGTQRFRIQDAGIVLTGGAAANITALSDGSTITIDMATASHHSVTLGGNRTFAAPSNQAVGQSGSIFITQDGTGSRTASFNSAFKFVGGTAPTLTTGAGLTDRIDYVIKSSNVIHCAVSLDVK